MSPVDPAREPAPCRRSADDSMSVRRSPHVTLTGDRSGEYVVVEERADGCLVVAPATASRPRPAPRPAKRHAGASGLLALLSRSAEAPRTIPEALEAWGVELLADESVTDFLLVDIDGRTGFAAVTNERFIFVAETDTGPGVAEEHRLTSVRDVELVRRAIRHKLRVAWEGSETIIGAADRNALSRLQQRLASGPLRRQGWPSQGYCRQRRNVGRAWTRVFVRGAR